MPSVREDRHVLGVIAADGQAADHGQKPGLLIPAVDADRILTGVGAVNILPVPGQPHGAGRGQIARLRSAGGGNGLDLLNHRGPFAGLVGEHIDDIFQLVHQIDEAAVVAEPEMPGSRLQVAADRVHLDQLVVPLVKTVDSHLVDAVVHAHDKAAVRGSPGTGHMGAEVALRNAAVALVEHAVHNIPD